MKGQLTIPTPIAIAAVVTLIVAVAAITYWVTPKQGMDTRVEDAVIEDSDGRTRELEKEASDLKEQIKQLKSAPREIEYITRTAKSKKDATSEIDSVSMLDFDAQAGFFTREETRLDSIFRDYKGSN